MELTKVKLGDYLDDFGDGIHGTPNYDENGEYYFINGNNLDNGAIFIDSETKRISSDEYESIKRNLNNRTLLLSINGTLGRLAYYNGENIALGKSACFLNFKENTDRRYFRYILEMKDFKQYMFKVASGSTIKNFSPRQAAEYEFFAPKIEDQKKIASVLSALDDKIALNKKMNQKLEAMAKRLYDYWFVQFDFPDKNGRPYKTTGGPMTYNPTLKREIPVGWEVSNICPLMEILPGGTPSKAKPEYWNGDIPFFGPTDYCGDVYQLSTEEHITEKGLNNCASALYPPKTIFITARGSVGKLIVCGKPMAMNQSCYALKPFDLDKYEYLFYLTKQLIEQLKKKGSGSVFKSINTLDIEQSFMSIAPNEIIELYCKKVKSIFERIKSNTVEIAKLTTLRDKLLPLLMNGQVVVG